MDETIPKTGEKDKKKQDKQNTKKRKGMNKNEMYFGGRNIFETGRINLLLFTINLVLWRYSFSITPFLYNQIKVLNTPNRSKDIQNNIKIKTNINVYKKRKYKRKQKTTKTNKQTKHKQKQKQKRIRYRNKQNIIKQQK